MQTAQDRAIATESEPPPDGGRAAALFKFVVTRPSIREAGATVVVVLILLAAMQIASWYVPDYIMPSPEAVSGAIWRLAHTDYFHVLATLGRLAAALSFSLVAGVLLGLVMALSPLLRPFVRSLVVIDTGIPALSWILLAVFWFKNPEKRIFFILVMILIPFYALSIYDGFRALPKDLVDMIESFRPSQWQTLRYLIVPHLVPYVILTTKSVIGYATRMVIFAELVASAIGVGSRMGLAQSTFHMDEVLAWTFFLVVLNIVLQLLVTAIEKAALGWRQEAAVR
ncbi:ABC transporter permease [Rhodopseudomonas sp. B29]|uniref:ABC transporter permease n=1 Tax=Rhodopseudomonas sp. B29 TaxID=95607 RepID=UPI00034DDB94|nr:ABC transporter permease subunit [Rhodopseudomonas sp. B29]